MPRTRLPLFTGAATSVVPTSNMEALVNWYPEINVQGERNQITFLPTPGITKLCDLANAQTALGAASPAVATPVALYYYSSSIFAIANHGDFTDHLFEIQSSQVSIPIDRGSLVGSTLGNPHYSICDNNPQVPTTGVGQQIIMVAPNGRGWVYNSSAQTLTHLGAGFENGTTVTFQDGYGIYTQLDTNTFWITKPYNFTSTPALNFASLESTSGNLVACKSDNTRLYLFGTTGLEVWYDSGDPAFPFTRIPGAVYPKGILSPRSLVKMDDSMIWLGTNENGVAQIFQMRGENPPQVISNPRIDWQLRRWKNVFAGEDISTDSCFAFTYQEKGHEFYVLTYSYSGTISDGTYPNTFVYDATNGMWHVRKSTNTKSTVTQPWFPGNYAFLSTFLPPPNSGIHVVCNNANINAVDTGIYYLDSSNATENGTAITRTAVSKHISNMNERVFIGDAEVIPGWSLDATTVNNYPNIPVGSTLTLSWAKNGNYNPTALATFAPPYTFANSFTYTLTSNPGQRMKMYRLGYARDWVFQLTTQANIAVLDAFVALRYTEEEDKEP